MNINNDRRPGRPLGVTLAIIASMLLYTCWPILQVVTILRLNSLMDTQDGITTGIQLTNVPEFVYFVQVFLSLVFFFVALLAWRGRPAIMRFVLVGAVLFFTVFSVVSNILPILLSQPSLTEGGLDSGQEVAKQLTTGQLIFTILLPVYVIWFMNRGPSRAFYRGFYLSDSNDAQKSSPQSET